MQSHLNKINYGKKNVFSRKNEELFHKLKCLWVRSILKGSTKTSYNKINTKDNEKYCVGDGEYCNKMEKLINNNNSEETKE